ncbi:MAG: glycosyltransferase family 1 protein [bacterium]|jgi:glycosyltransferase involved in cell wall biosynthesis
MRIAIVTDGWLPQVSGVVTTLVNVKEQLEAMGHEVKVIGPDFAHRHFHCPSYPEVELAVFPFREISRALDAFRPDAIHIASEVTVGLAARRYCVKRGIPFTTAYHTRFPEYIRQRYPVPLRVSYSYFRWFHSKAAKVLVPTASIKQVLESRGFRNIVLWERGVDTNLFKPRERYEKIVPDWPRPVMLYVGRVAVEKNIEAFLDLDLPGTKIVVGDGPERVRLESEYPNAVFTGYKADEELAEYYAASDVFVFPSRTDTYGIVLLEALASGTPVAAFPVPGPMDLISDGATGALDNDLEAAVRRALLIRGSACREFALEMSWRKCAADFLAFQAQIDERKFTVRRFAMPIRSVRAARAIAGLRRISTNAVRMAAVRASALRRRLPR